MTYTPTEWKNGDVITAEKLNKLEDGVASAGGGVEPFVVTFSQPEFGGAVTADKTYTEIHEALQQGKVVSGILNRVNGMFIYPLHMCEEPGGIQGFCVKPYFENGAVTKFEVKTVSILPNGDIYISDCEKQ
jgi:hypothetical protein